MSHSDYIGNIYLFIPYFKFEKTFFQERICVSILIHSVQLFCGPVKFELESRSVLYHRI